MQLRVLFAIRSDRMALLGELTDSMPDILKNLFEIKSLTPRQAEAAILKPARADGAFASEKFEFEPALLNSILDFLIGKGKNRRIESFMIQLICQAIERRVRENHLLTVKREDVGSLENIVELFYADALKDLPAAQQAEAQRLIEEGLITRTGETDGRREYLFRSQIRKYYEKVTDETLAILSKNRLLKEERDDERPGDMRYEIAHDALVPPVLRLRVLREKDEQAAAERRRRAAAESREIAQKRREIGYGVSTEISWERIGRAIGNNKAVVILGTNAICDEFGVPLIKRFAEHAIRRRDDIGWFDSEHLFSLPDNRSRVELEYEFTRFYEEQPIPDWLQVIAKMPFPLIISCDPSGILLNAYKSVGRPVTFAYKRAGIRGDDLGKFNSALPLLYNLFGVIDERESLVLTMPALLRHFTDLACANPIPPNIRSYLMRTNIVVLIGYNFLSSFSTALLYTLFQEDHGRMFFVLKPGGDLNPLEQLAASILNVHWLEMEPIDFLMRLQKEIPASNDETLIRRVDAGSLRKLVEEGEMNRAITLLLEFTEGNRSIQDELLQLSARLSNLERNYRVGLMESSGVFLERNKIAASFLYLLEKIEQLP
ncbi:MAG: hypothetical protein IPH12_04370 [Saprospirales bacterium]|nr:hypothetical protein [Saprospirales bacterium]